MLGMGDGGCERRLAECQSCGEIYPVNVVGDGELQPIGLEDCPCGDAEFTLLDSSDVEE